MARLLIIPMAMKRRLRLKKYTAAAVNRMRFPMMETTAEFGEAAAMAPAMTITRKAPPKPRKKSPAFLSGPL